MSVLSDDDTDHAGGSLPHGLEFHLSRCPGCRALAHDLRNVGNRLTDLASDNADPSLFERANQQALFALQRGGEMTGRVHVEPEPLAPPRVSAPWWRPTRLAPLATAAAVVIAVTIYGLRPKPTTESVTHQPEGAATSIPQNEKPQAALAGDALTTDGDPTGIPREYRGEDCQGDDCVERAFVPRRGRRPTESPRLDTAARPESTKPAPNDP